MRDKSIEQQTSEHIQSFIVYRIQLLNQEACRQNSDSSQKYLPYDEGITSHNFLC
jgi:hypothetical protein